MKFVRQTLATIKVTNCDDKLRSMGANAEMRKHGTMLPTTICGIICGPSNCGKTNVLISLIESPHGVRFENVYVYLKSLQQPKYRYLENLLTSIDEIDYFTFSNNNDVIPPSEARPNSIFVFDDVACDKQDVVREYFSMGRHSSVDCFYLCQTYARIPKHLIRDNANLLILFKQNGTNLKHVYNHHVNTDMSNDEFCALCCDCWQHKYGFVVIDKDSSLNDGSLNDAGIWSNTAMKQAFENNTISVPQARCLPNTNCPLPFSIVGDEGFPLKTYIMRPYAKRNLQSNDQKVFNYRLSRARRVVENAFGILVAQWRILQKPLALKLNTAEKIVQAITCLHNYIMSTNLQNNSYFNERMIDREIADGEIIAGSWRNEIEENGFMNPVGRVGANIGTATAMRQRETLARYFVSEEGSIPYQWQHI